MSDTPQTDAFDKGAFGPRREQWVDFARRLERERDAAIEQRRCECAFDEACRFARERNALREENQQFRDLCIELRNALNAHTDYRIQHNGGYTKERILIEKTDKLLTA